MGPIHPQTPSNRAAVTLAKKSARPTPRYRGRLGEAKTSSSASGSTMASDWTRKEKKGAGSKEACESIRLSATSTLRQAGASAMATCMFTI